VLEANQSVYDRINARYGTNVEPRVKAAGSQQTVTTLPKSGHLQVGGALT
jgi:hypothetical protein